MAMMISKFHKLIQSKTVWIAFAVIISIAFVWSFSGSSPGSQPSARDDANEVVGRLFGEDVTRTEFVRAYQNAHLMLIIRTGQLVNITDQIDQYIRQDAWGRLAILKKAGQMGLTVSDEQVANAIRQQPIFLNQQTRQFDRNAYNAFFGQMLPRLGIRFSPADFQIMVTENLLIEKATRTAIHSALVTDAEVDHAFHVYSDKLTLQHGTIPRSMAPAPEVTEAEARAYYDSYPNQFVYPDKVKVRYVEFPVADYTNGVEITGQMVTNLYNNNKQMFVVEGTEADAVPQFQPIDEVRDRIVDLAVGGLGRAKAQNAAGLFVSQLSASGATFDSVADEAGKTIHATAPFAVTDTVRGIDPTAEMFTRAAFSLQDNPNHYYSDPVSGRDSVYVLALQSKMPSFLPDFEVVAEEAMEAATITAGEKAYIEKAEAVHAALEAALEAGSSFEDAAAKAGLKITTTDPISLAEPPEDDLGMELLQQTALYGAGTLVDLIPTEDEYIVAYVAGKEAADRFMADPMIISQLRSSVQNDKASRLIAAWRDSILEEAQLEDLLGSAGNDNS